MTLLLAPVIIPSLPAEAQTFKVLYTFAGCTEGANPVGTLLLRAGILYGTTSGGDCTGESSNVFQFDTETGQETTLYTFGAPGDGVAPRAGLIRDSLGNLYGTTSSGYGTVFEIDSANTETVLHSFTGVDGYSPRAPLVRDSAGNLYGTTEIGGLYVDWGTVFKLDTAGTLTVLYNFGAKPGDGESPLAGLLIENGNLYGTTQGDLADFLYGTVYQLNPQTGEMTVLYSFGGGSDGSTPAAGLIGDRAGNLYGTTYYGGKGWGVVFKLTLATRAETVLYAFNGSDGANPYAGLIRDAEGNLYGTTYAGGASNFGTVFKLDTTGELTTLYSFTGGADGGNPYAGLAMDSKGRLYGTTYGNILFPPFGTVFEITP